MALADSAALMNDTLFRDRVTVAVVRRATMVADEAADAGDVVAGKRAALATQALTNVAAVAANFQWAVAANPTVSASAAGGQANVPDGDIEYVVASVWNDLAGVTAADRSGPIPG